MKKPVRVEHAAWLERRRREHWRKSGGRRITHIIGWIAIGSCSFIALATIWNWIKDAFAWP